MKNWDSEIDDAAREMTRGESDAGLRARVLARIDALDARASTRRSLWAWSPVALAAAAVLAFLIVRAPWSDGTVPLEPDATAFLVNTETVPDANKTAVAPVVSGLPALSVSEGSRTGVGARTAAPLSVATGPALVEDLVARAGDMESIAPAPLEIEPLAIDAIAMMESIEITRLEVALLDVPLLLAQQ